MPVEGVSSVINSYLKAVIHDHEFTNLAFGDEGLGSVGVSRDYPMFGAPIISGTSKATDFKFGKYMQRVHPNKSPLNILEKRERVCIQGLPNFWATAYYLRNG